MMTPHPLLFFFSFAFLQMIARLEIRCGLKSKGCKWSGEVEKLQHHKDNDCIYEMVECSYEQCGSKLQRRNLDKHIASCAYRTVPCEYCAEMVVLRERGRHLEECVSAPVFCPNEGCGGKTSRNSLAEHERGCLKSRVVCPFAQFGCSDLITREGFNAHMAERQTLHLITMTQISSTKITNLEKEVASQRQLIQSHQNEISKLENEVAKQKQVIESHQQETTKQILSVDSKQQASIVKMESSIENLNKSTRKDQLELIELRGEFDMFYEKVESDKERTDERLRNTFKFFWEISNFEEKINNSPIISTDIDVHLPRLGKCSFFFSLTGTYDEEDNELVEMTIFTNRSLPYNGRVSFEGTIIHAKREDGETSTCFSVDSSSGMSFFIDDSKTRGQGRMPYIRKEDLLDCLDDTGSLTLEGHLVFDESEDNLTGNLYAFDKESDNSDSEKGEEEEEEDDEEDEEEEEEDDEEEEDN
jgi:hypothetical protein